MQDENGWRQAGGLVVAGGLVMGVALGIRHVQGLFLLPVSGAHGWARDTFALAIAMQNLVWGLAQPVAGWLADRYGAARVLAGSMLLYGLGLLAMTQAATPAGFMLSAGLCIGVALAGTTFTVVYGLLSRRVLPGQRSWALGTAGAIGGLGQFLLVPVVQAGIDSLGWAGALVLLAAAMLALLPLLPALRDSPQPPPSGSAAADLRSALSEALRHRGFWMLNLGFLACGFQLAFMASHLPAYLLDRGLSARDGVLALALIALANVAGTYACGWLGGRFPRKYLLSFIYLLRSAAISLFLMLPISPATVHLFAVVMGLMWLGTAPLTNGLVSQVFGVRYIGTLFGLVFLGHQLGAFLGVWLGGWIYEATRSYDSLWIGAMVLGVVAALLHWPIDDRPLALPPARPGVAA